MSWVHRMFGDQPQPETIASRTIAIHAPRASTPFTADLSLIRDYAPELEREAPLKAKPYIAHFHRDGKDLYYIAAFHHRGPETDTFKAIRAAMAHAKPQVVVMEGLPTSLGFSPVSHQQYIKDHAAKNFAECDEPEYLAYQAMQAGIPYIGGEPDDAQIVAQMAKKGYSDKDVMAFYLLRMMPHWVENHEISPENFDAKAQDYLNTQAYYLDNNIPIPVEKRLTVAEFKAWYEAHNDRPGRTYFELNSQNLAPVRSQHASYFERMSADIGEVREQHLDTVIAELSAQHDRVLVAYGQGHLLQSRKVFDKMFGGSENLICPN